LVLPRCGKLIVYVIEVLQIDISFATSEEYAKGSRPE
jgi:hypothetical protein